jgi:hypothetical protein
MRRSRRQRYDAFAMMPVISSAVNARSVVLRRLPCDARASSVAARVSSFGASTVASRS